MLARSGFSASSAERLMQLQSRQLSDAARQRVDVLIPQIVALSSESKDPDATLARLLDLLDAVMRRVSYLAFLAEYPEALKRLARLLAASSWAASYLAQHPALLDELLDAREFYQPPSWPDIERDLDERLSGLDAERQLDVLHQVQQEQVFYLLAMDLQGLLPLEKLSDHLSDLADMVLGRVLKLCWTNARKKHAPDARFAIIAYGKLGGREMGYASDIDMVFLYDDEAADAPERYGALARKLVWWLTAATPAGGLFEIDTRLRPNGNAGLLVTSLDAFEQYQLGRGSNTAWTWEHQALTRARFCAGDASLGARFEAIRAQVLGMPRDGAALRAEVAAMRRRVAEGHPNRGALFDLKHDPGGMVDVEFAVQALVLEHASAFPQLVANVGNIALLRLAEQLGLLPPRVGRLAAVAYRRLRRLQHAERLRGAEQAALVEPARVARERAAVQALSHAVFGHGEAQPRAAGL